MIYIVLRLAFALNNICILFIHKIFKGLGTDCQESLPLWIDPSSASDVAGTKRSLNNVYRKND